ncbi:MAG TPA: lipoprotein signal peptidase [Flammeovirgaceae bacterium]|nr:lipoprotein signal peptidase [Flammeovirgaceae bacterium]
MKYYKYFLLTLAVVVIDQLSKYLVHHNMHLYEEFNVLGDWFRIHYILNEGIAFGLKADWPYSKVVLTLFRLIASVVGVVLLYKYARKDTHPGALWAGALILAGAIGNLIDSMFYGLIYDNAPYNAPFRFLNGQVIDMLYFPLFSFVWPAWVPFVGGQDFHFFSAIFNIADSSIFIGVMILLIWQKKFFPDKKKESKPVVSSAKSESEWQLQNTLEGSEEDCCLPE